ncbi:MAG: Gfo/Idh/MocA family oxidoreductase [Chloroflexi bacterium]|nr:Gfo/Idh/MocA family oxidoreductase [Chloroflexota bacterium]
MAPIRLGIFGAGTIVRAMYAPSVEAVGTERLKVVAVADLQIERSQALAARFGAGAYSDPHELLQASDVEAVLVATTIGTHAELALAALRAGKHVLLQKPMATSLEEAEAILEAARAAGVILQCEPPHVLHPYSRRARQDIAAGVIGRPCLMVARSAHRGPQDRSWFYYQDQGGSVIFDMGVHAITWVLGLLGPVASVTARMVRSIPERMIGGQEVKPDIEDNAVLVFQMCNGALATVLTNYCTAATQLPAIEVTGESGTIVIDGPMGGYALFRQPITEMQGTGADGAWIVPTFTRALIARQSPTREQVTAELAQYSSLAYFVRAVERKEEPVANGEIARHALEVMLASRRAAETGMSQQLHSSFDTGRLP